MVLICVCVRLMHRQLANFDSGIYTIGLIAISAARVFEWHWSYLLK
jgi:hypothetical protein